MMTRHRLRLPDRGIVTLPLPEPRRPRLSPEVHPVEKQSPLLAAVGRLAPALAQTIAATVAAALRSASQQPAAGEASGVLVAYSAPERHPHYREITRALTDLGGRHLMHSLWLLPVGQADAAWAALRRLCDRDDRLLVINVDATAGHSQNLADLGGNP
jgi:hypothetical protein